MKRYIVHKEGLSLLNITTSDAMTELASDKVITNEALEYRHLPYISVVLSEAQVLMLTEAGINFEEEKIQAGVTLADNTGYEKLRTEWVKTQKRAISGLGCKVGHMDSGSTIAVVPYDFGYNFIDNNTNVTDVFGHGTITSSIIKHPIIAVAPDCELHILKVLTDGGFGNESAILAGFDYCIDNSLDVVNLSWSFDTTAIRAAAIALAATNCIVVVAAGNSSSLAATTVPACLPGCVAVNAVDANGDPYFYNVLVPDGIPGAHGITVACNGVSCQSYNIAGNYAGCWGTSCSAPFFTGVFAMYKEQLGISDNKRILDYILAKSNRLNYSNFYGAGVPTF